MKLKDLFVIIKEHEIIRRYMSINSFDGALTILGILMASFIAGIRNPALVILPCVGAAVALCVSGIWSAYAAEAAEVKKKMKELEKHMLRPLHTTKKSMENKYINLLVGLVNGFSPFIIALVIIMPFFLSSYGLVNVMNAYYASTGIIAVVLFSLGMFLGRIAKENIFFNAFKMLLAGVIIAAIFYVLALLNIL
jgi:predicted membrane protein (TIGR00267 family)